MVIQPRIKGFLCTTAHPLGCEQDVANQIGVVTAGGKLKTGPQRVLVIGASGGYGLASRISAAFGCASSTIGVFFERPSKRGRTASPGWYKSAAFTEAAHEAGLYAKNFNGDAFSAEMKSAVIDCIKRDLGQVDMVIYSLAAPARTLASGETVRSVLKPIGESFAGSTIDFNTRQLRSLQLEPAQPQEIADTVKVMGGEDWEDWINTLLENDCLAEGCLTTNYTYLGSEVTWPIYYHGTIGKAKEDLDRAAANVARSLDQVSGKAHVVVMKGLLTQAASAIPGMSVYLSLLFKAMKRAGSHEGCIEQTDRLFRTQLFAGEPLRQDEAGRIRMDDLELDDAIQDYVRRYWNEVNQENLEELTDFEGYRQAFLQLHGFDFAEVNYTLDIEPEVSMQVEALE
ncbi:MAG: trans-2-enoyl-CoA reductase family protein [Gammaproteobacteria bacterium]|jgi:enoyl-[acyl-carrier protein] reductase / trans-2-enoyl-CoA reductase (NAD+)|nr:trans-2-enoyl-CoA reductase family protein [Gammaproteobacteria bacterium]MBT5205254.1 trans-2-enoyl-CoA reductase family protein [Gammaproteobacteria bacterium]MBT5601048.1 trans-2-enoyl-CoA reductase family protein [Gammaproteobacteria bacterium]MBT6244934.1 trans-2-enoyl-CoA reductase family protein [Gammaproteobacteria bacterium]